MKINKETGAMSNNFERSTQKQLEIMLLFNELIKLISPENNQDLIIPETEKYDIFLLLKSRLRTLESIINDKAQFSEEIFAIYVFKALFIGENDLNWDDLEEKKECFKLVLITIKKEYMNKMDEKKLINIRNEAEKSSLCKLLSLFNCFIVNNKGYYFFCFSLIFKYMKLNSLLVDSFITYAKNEMLLLNTNLVLRKEYKDEEIDKISKDALINDLISIYGKIDNYSCLYLDNNHLRIKKVPNKEINEVNHENKCVGKKRKKKKKNKKKKKQNNIINKNVTKDKNELGGQ